MPKALWNNQVIAESSVVETVEGNLYFPPSSLNKQYFTPSPTTSHCHWKGQASYYTITVEGKTNPDAAWYYPAPLAAAANIAHHVAFWKGVQVVE
jgi:uncharacterized protein (DUF427 family)